MVSWFLSLLTVVHAQFVPFGFMGNKPCSIQHIVTLADPVDTGHYLFSNVDLGTPHDDRYILVGVLSRSGSGYNISSVTVGGIAATQVYNVVSNNSVAGFYLVAKPTGASGDIRVQFSGNMVRAGITVWQVRGLRSMTSVSSASLNSGNTYTQSVNVPAQGIAAALFFNTTTGSTANPALWQGARSDAEVFMTDTGINAQFSAASVQTGVALPSRSISVHPSIFANAVGAVITLR